MCVLRLRRDGDVADRARLGLRKQLLRFLRESRRETSLSLHPVQEGREALGFGIGNIYKKDE